MTKAGCNVKAFGTMNETSDKYKGYRNKGLSILKKFGVEVWCDVRIETTKGVFEGLILPRASTEDACHIVIR